MESGSRRTRLFDWCVRSSLCFIMLVAFAVVINAHHPGKIGSFD